jgi:hypothetical protein
MPLQLLPNPNPACSGTATWSRGGSRRWKIVKNSISHSLSLYLSISLSLSLSLSLSFSFTLSNSLAVGRLVPYVAFRGRLVR